MAKHRGVGACLERLEKVHGARQGTSRIGDYLAMGADIAHSH